MPEPAITTVPESISDFIIVNLFVVQNLSNQNQPIWNQWSTTLTPLPQKGLWLNALQHVTVHYAHTYNSYVAKVECTVRLLCFTSSHSTSPMYDTNTCMVRGASLVRRCVGCADTECANNEVGASRAVACGTAGRSAHTAPAGDVTQACEEGQNTVEKQIIRMFSPVRPLRL